MSGAPPRSAPATLLILFSALCFGAIAIFITLGLRSGARLIDLLFWRYAIASVLLIIVSGGAAAVRSPGRRAIPLFVLAGIGQAVIAFVSLSSLKYIPAASLTFLFYTYPAWIAVISAIRGERLTAPRVAALAISLTGIAVMVGVPGAGAGLHPMGVGLALAAALLYALYVPMINHFGNGIAPAVTSVFAAGGAAVALLIASLTQGGPRFDLTPTAWAMVALLAGVSTVLAFIAFLRGLAVIGPVRTGIVSTVEPFFTALLASVFLDQALGSRTLLGGALIAAAVIIIQLAPGKPTTEH